MESLKLWEAHLQNFLKSYTNNLYWIENNFLPDSQVCTLIQSALQLEKANLLRKASIGKGHLKQQATEIRSDKISWLEDYNSPGGKIATQLFSELQLICRRDFFLPAKRYECHIAKYETGDKYLKHKDRHKNKPGRLLTCVLYLNYCQANSGNLIIYPKNQNPIRVSPTPGKIVVFDSGITHEVAEAHKDRWSLTGWIRDDLHPSIKI